MLIVDCGEERLYFPQLDKEEG